MTTETELRQVPAKWCPVHNSVWVKYFSVCERKWSEAGMFGECDPRQLYVLDEIDDSGAGS